MIHDKYAALRKAACRKRRPYEKKSASKNCRASRAIAANRPKRGSNHKCVEFWNEPIPFSSDFGSAALQPANVSTRTHRKRGLKHRAPLNLSVVFSQKWLQLPGEVHALVVTPPKRWTPSENLSPRIDLCMIARGAGRYAGSRFTGRSRFVRLEDIDRLDFRFADARAECVPESGHNPHVETGGKFVRIVRGFLGSRGLDGTPAPRGDPLLRFMAQTMLQTRENVRSPFTNKTSRIRFRPEGG